MFSTSGGPAVEEGEGGMRSDAGRRHSTVGVRKLTPDDPLFQGRDPAIVQIAVDNIQKMDRDNDGRVDVRDIGTAFLEVAEEAQRSMTAARHLRRLAEGLGGVSVLVAAICLVMGLVVNKLTQVVEVGPNGELARPGWKSLPEVVSTQTTTEQFQVVLDSSPVERRLQAKEKGGGPGPVISLTTGLRINLADAKRLMKLCYNGRTVNLVHNRGEDVKSIYNVCPQTIHYYKEIEDEDDDGQRGQLVMSFADGTQMIRSHDGEDDFVIDGKMFHHGQTCQTQMDCHGSFTITDRTFGYLTCKKNQCKPKTVMSQMFQGICSLDEDTIIPSIISEWNVSSVTDFRSMFNTGCSDFDLDLSGWSITVDAWMQVANMFSDSGMNNLTRCPWIKNRGHHDDQLVQSCPFARIEGDRSNLYYLPKNSSARNLLRTFH